MARRAATDLLRHGLAIVVGGAVLVLGMGVAGAADPAVGHEYGADTVIAAAATADGDGLWTLTAGGTVHGTDTARVFGALHYGLDPVAIAGTADGGGYWIATASGRVYPFGDATELGGVDDLGLNAAIVGMASTPDHNGYWLLGSDGGVFSFGDAAFFGSTGALRLNQPVVSMASTSSGRGYWLVAPRRRRLQLR